MGRSPRIEGLQPSMALAATERMVCGDGLKPEDWGTLAARRPPGRAAKPSARRGAFRLRIQRTAIQARLGATTDTRWRWVFSSPPGGTSEAGDLSTWKDTERVRRAAALCIENVSTVSHRLVDQTNSKFCSLESKLLGESRLRISNLKTARLSARWAG